jgi:hypothetical protein
MVFWSVLLSLSPFRIWINAVQRRADADREWRYPVVLSPNDVVPLDVMTEHEGRSSVFTCA